MIEFKATLIIPTYNSNGLGNKCFNVIQDQNIDLNVLIIDSGSTDNTLEVAEQHNFQIYRINQSDFNHGGTRNLGVELMDSDTNIIIFMTQDALLASSNSISNLLCVFEDPLVSAAYGRQLPHNDASPLATHARLFNYPEISIVKSQKNIPQLGIKTAFISNSFAAYRASVFKELGGFPNDVILAEDMGLAARMILKGYKVVYCADATVKHSHNYSLKQEFQRYFDIGVFQAKEPWIQEKFGAAAGEGKRFILSELKYLWKHAPGMIPKALCSTFFKYLGFKLGLNWYKLPLALVIKLSMHKRYWRS